MKEMPHTDLSSFNNSWYQKGSNPVSRILWYLLHAVFFDSWIPGSKWRIAMLNVFGASVAYSVVIKPHVKIKYPWRLKIGANSWIGEKVWIDNLGNVSIGDNCCLSQGAMLLCGNHNYKKPTFDLIVGDITLESGVWIGAQALVCPGINCASHSVLTAHSIAAQNLDAWGVYSGNPAQKVREREMES
jgi:putative colanic acid biosynthesis acetyltransferase WcaF